ncbi:MAG: methionyl-tRNA formyltransferase [Patescibacteria group bacterium]|jgi:methionyl-tRNA formyltransferase
MKSTTLTASFLLTEPQSCERPGQAGSKLRVAFFGTPEFAARFLSGLIDDPYFHVVGVVTQPDEPVGRMKILTPPPVKTLALEKCVPVYQPTKIKDEFFLKAIEGLKADIFVIVAYGRILPQALLDMPRLGCVNVHPSKLPKYRGPSPMQAALTAGDKQTAVTIMKIDALMDHGPILAQEELDIADDETVATLTDKVVALGEPLLRKTLKAFHEGNIVPVEQDHERATLCKILTRENGKISLSEDPIILDRKIRALNPWPGIWTLVKHDGKELRVKILRAKLADGKLDIQEVQPEGGKPMPIADFTRGYGKLL